MSKRALAILVAVSMVGLFGCNDDKKEDASQGSKCERSFCNGDISVYCLNGVEQTQNCGTAGCNQVTGLCNPSSQQGNQCTQNRCNGDVSIYCLNGNEQTQNCGNAGCNQTTGLCNSSQGMEKCTQNYCNGDISIYCLGGESMLQNCAEAGCNAATGLCNSSHRATEDESAGCTRNQCMGAISNMCVNGVNYLVDCGTAGCNAMTGLCNSPSTNTPAQCSTSSCAGSISNMCVNGTLILRDCGSAGCNESTGLCNQTSQQASCTTSSCVGSVANMCISGQNFPVACGSLGCNPSTGTCNEPGQGTPSTPQCTADSCSGNYLNLCVDGKIATRDCGTEGCDPATARCKSSSSVVVECLSSSCVGNTANVCKNGTLVTMPCGVLECNPETAMCNTEIPETPGALTYGGNVGDACDTLKYKQSCIHEGTGALYCDNGIVKQLFCSSCRDAGYDPAKPLQVYCENGSGNSSDLTEGGNVGDSCSRSNYKSTCINNGKNALICWNDEVTQWDCDSCEDAGWNPEKPLDIKCTKDTPDITEGGSLGSECQADYYRQTCINGGANALVCVNGVVSQWDCADNNCTAAGYNPEQPLRVNCPMPVPEGCVSTAGTPNVDCCVGSNYQVSCINGNANALVCVSGTVREWACADNVCSITNNLVNCPKPQPTCVTSGGNPGDCCDEETYENTCISDNANALVCLNGKIKKWTCADSHCAVTNNEVDCPKPDNGGSDCVTIGGTVGDCCKYNSYTPSCINSNANALVCAQGKIKQWDCADHTCSVEGKSVYCPEDTQACVTEGGEPGDCCDEELYAGSCSGNTGLLCLEGTVVANDCESLGLECLWGFCFDFSQPDCPTTGGEAGDCCDETEYQPTCINGNANALVCKNGSVKQWTCAGNACSVNGTEVNCPDPCVTTGGNVGDCCNASKYEVSCINGNANALVCAQGKVKQWNCANNTCSVADNKVNCPEPQNPDCATTGGNVGECCQKAYYQSSCSEDGSTALICSSSKIKQLTCETNSCTIADNYVTCN